MQRIVLAIGAIVVVTAAALWFGARHEVGSDAMPAVEADAGPAERGAAAFVGADFGGLSLHALESHAVPWKLVTAALVLEAVDGDPTQSADRKTLNNLLASFGFLVQTRVQNMPEGVSDRSDALPLGITHGVLSPLAGLPVQVANMGCAACHAGVTYRTDGQPNPTAAWIGMPNTSLNLEAYTQAVFRTLKAYQDAPARLMEMVATLYPETGWRERQALRWLVLLMVRARLDQIPGDRPLPFFNGVPGSTNGVAALKHVFDVPLFGDGLADAGIVSIPDLGHRHWRSSLLVDGAYAVPQTERQAETTVADNTAEKRAALAAITTFFTVPSMGVHPSKAIEAVPLAEDIYAFLNSTYRSQPFPGVIDNNLALAGHAIYAAECAACHGAYDVENGRPKLISFPNWLGDVGTDPLRAAAFTEDLADTFRDTPYRDQIAVARTEAYVAPPLDGIWASAPYLHNGSVPTVWHLLTPDQRPETFEVGGHMLDFTRLGLRLQDGRYPFDYAPFSKPVILDTTHPGLGNGGHDFGATLSEADKSALIEFLKQL
ncbi:hypothetical protein [uncultured Roseobacter sp.]|uniref:c-type cytochrome n=1 Tax=uncultured Roseobacter sp. TaxID=114847 RepID=UPI0026188748|nr:hypothetical protein [uncultured Roseobacter sp.]